MTARMRIIGPLLAGFFSSVLLLGCGGGSSNPPPSVEIYGDSIPFGPGIQSNIAAQIRILRPEWIVIDVSASGADLRDVLDGYAEPYANAPREAYPAGPQPALSKRVKAGQYQVIAVGGNDALGMSTQEDFESRLREVVRVIRSEGRIPIITGIVNAPPSEAFNLAVLARRDELNGITHAIAKEYGLQHAGWGEDYRGEVDTIADRIHRTQEASDRLAALLIEAIERAQ